MPQSAPPPPSPPAPPAGPVPSSASTRPYLIRALHDWCTDNGYTPYLAVFVDGTVQVPAEYVKNNEIVLNTSFEATSGLQLGNDFISFKARFGGLAREIRVPIDHVIAVYARENGQGMAFPSPMLTDAGTADAVLPADTEPASPRGALRLAPAPGAEMAVPVAASAPASQPTRATAKASADDPEPPPGGRPTLKRIK
jgi:stringent starvation protein B